jgi:phosphoribosylanthranilate isomerase
MMRTRVKVCGITRQEDAWLAVELGADAVGFVFWPGSPRCVDPAKAAAIARGLPPFVTCVGVFVSQPLDDIRGVARAAGLGAIQLHGEEPAEMWAKVPGACIKAIGVGEAFDVASLSGWPVSVLPLLDVHDPARRGGTGRAVDWTVAAAAARVRPVVLAGGLRPENVEDAIQRVHPYAVDVSSGVEREPGIKDAVRLRAFFEGVARADAGTGL